MASMTLSFQINSEKLTLLEKHQKLRARGSISTDLFAKELVFEKLGELELASIKKKR